MDLVDSKYITYYHQDFQNLKELNQTYLIFVVRFVVTHRNIRIKQEDISIRLKQILILSVIIVEQVLHLIIF